MNAMGITLLWCMVQVTLLGLFAGAVYLVVRRLLPAAAAPVALSGLLTVVLLSVLATAPWPRWPMATVGGSSVSGHDTNPKRQRGSSLALRVGVTAAETPAGEKGEVASVSSQQVTGRNAPGGELPKAGLWWQTLLDELARSKPVVPEPSLRWPAVLAAFVLTGMILGSGWLLLGLVAVRSQRARSRPVEDQAVWELINTLRAELHCQRRVEVRQCNDLVTTATIGWRPPGHPSSRRTDRVDRRPAACRAGSRNRPCAPQRFSGRALRPVWAGTPLLPPSAPLADELPPPGTGIGRRRGSRKRDRRPEALSYDNCRTCPAAGRPVADVGSPLVLAHTNELSKENRYVAGCQVAL